MKIRKSIAILLLCLVVCGGTAYGVQSGLTAATANKSVITQTAETVTDKNVNKQAATADSAEGTQGAENDASGAVQSTDAAAQNTDELADGTAQSTDAAAAKSASGSSFTALTTLIDTSDLFTDRDLAQTADTSSAAQIALTDGQNITISEEGVYLVTGNASDATIIVEAADSAKVQLVLDNVTITNKNAPAIYVKSANKVFVTSTGDNALSTTGAFNADGTTNLDAVIFSKSDLVLNGTGSLTISSTANGISGKDDLKFTGGTYTITATKDAVEAHDSIRISDGNFTINAGKDAFHSEYDDDDSVGYVYIAAGTFAITAGDDGIQGTTYTIIDGGTFTISGAEGIEGTGVQINGGSITIDASDDGINAASKTTQFSPFIEINDGVITINMGQGDTDALDSNGSLTINGGTIDITGQSAFDYDGAGALNGGSVTVNGTAVNALTQTGPGGHGGKGGNGGMGGFGDGSGMGGRGGFGGKGGRGGFGGNSGTGDFPQGNGTDGSTDGAAGNTDGNAGGFPQGNGDL